MRVKFFLFALLLLFNIAMANDPGLPDSVIIGSAVVNGGPGAVSVDLPVWFKTDDSVSFYNIPISWNDPAGAVRGGDITQYFYPTTVWDCAFDSTVIDFMRVLGWANLNIDTVGLNPSIMTGYNRSQIMTLHFDLQIDSANHGEQIITIDTTRDSRNGSILFGLRDGVTEVSPKFQSGTILIPATGIDDNNTIPLSFDLGQNYPNPFNPSTAITFTIPRSCHVSLTVFNLLGAKVRDLINSDMSIGRYNAVWDGKDYLGTDVPSGTYFYRITAGDFVDRKKMTLVR